MTQGLTRRDTLKLSGLALGGLTLGAAARASAAEITCPTKSPCYPTDIPTTGYKYFDDLLPITPWTYNAKGEVVGEKLAPNEMRITFMGTAIPAPRRAQGEMSIFVEVGWDEAKNAPVDQAIFDIGAGVSANYSAAGVGFGRMDKIFVNHLHGDHMNDLTHVYCFGPSGDRKSPLYVWGPSASGVRNPDWPYNFYNDGTKAYCKALRNACRWHTESFSFQGTRYLDYVRPTRKSWRLPHEPIPVGDDDPSDGYALVPIELDWTHYGQRPGDNIAYWNRNTDVKVTHFPVIHCRQGSIGYKLEWNGLSMIYTSDTRPETHCIQQAIAGKKGVDVFIHEMVVPPEVWAMKNMGLKEPGSGDGWEAVVEDMTRVQDSSHTPQGAFGYLLSQIDPKPRLTVATHFPVAEDTVACALKSVQNHVPTMKHGQEEGNMTWSFDLMVLQVFTGNPKPLIRQRKAVVSDFGFSPVAHITGAIADPKYAEPTDQLDQSTEIKSGSDTYCENGY
jgi:ribonuclease Z